MVQPVVELGGGWRLWEGYLVRRKVSHDALQKKCFKNHKYGCKDC